MPSAKYRTTSNTPANMASIVYSRRMNTMAPW